MSTTTMSLPPRTEAPGIDDDPFDLDITVLGSSPVVPELLRTTSDNCGQTCATACNSCRS